MERSVSVEDFLSGLLRLNKASAKMGGLGTRTDSEAAFQEFLKRIPSATALSSQNADDKPLFGSASTTSLFGFGGAHDANMHRVASLDMLRTLEDAATRNSLETKAIAQAAGQSAAPASQAQLFQPAQRSGVSQEGAEDPPTTAAMPSPQAVRQTGQDSGVQGALPATSMLMAPPTIASLPLQLPAGNVLAYQQGLVGQNALLAHGAQALQHATSGHAGTSASADQSSPASAEKRASSRGGASAGGAGGGTTSALSKGGDPDKVTERRARRMLSNRESARRSRKRKQEQLQELEGQIETLEKKTASLESQCQAAAVHVQKLMTDKQQLENENQHLMSIFQQLQKSLGKDTIRQHLPAALAGPPPGEAPAAGAPQSSPRNGQTCEGCTAEEEKREPETGRGKRSRDSSEVKAEPDVPVKSRRSAAKKASAAS